MHFRDQLIAASLKPKKTDAYPLIVDNFRDQLIAASLKRFLPHSAQGTARLYFRDQLIAASLKPDALIQDPLPAVISAIN